jgi:hypothetical protein
MMNVQHLESLNDQVWEITGIRVRETIPDWVVQQADEVVIVDLSPRALIHRLERGVIYDREKVERALQNFFRESTLVALRELVRHSYLPANGISPQAFYSSFSINRSRRAAALFCYFSRTWWGAASG